MKLVTGGVIKDTSQQAASLRALADRVESGEVTDYVIAAAGNGDYEFHHNTNVINRVFLSALLQRNAMDAMLG